MKTNKKLSINELKIQSFVTSVKKADADSIIGAMVVTKNNPLCITNGVIIESPCNVTRFGCQLD